MVVGGPCDYCVSPVQRIGFWGFSDFVRTFGSGLGTVGTGDSDLDLGLTINYIIHLKDELERTRLSQIVLITIPLCPGEGTSHRQVFGIMRGSDLTQFYHHWKV